MKSGATLIHLTARNTFNSSSHCVFNTSKVEVKNIRGTACISVLIKEGERRNVSRDKHDVTHAGWSLLASTFGDVPSGLYLTPQVSLGFWLVSLTQQKGVFLLLCTFSQEAWKSSLVCGITLEVWERGSVLLIPNHGHNSISIQSLALTQSISN